MTEASEPSTPDVSLTCPLCGAEGMRSRSAGKTTGALRRCRSCHAEFRESSPGVWRLEYVDPDAFHRAARTHQRVPIMEAHPWEAWEHRRAGATSGPATSPTSEEAPPGDLEPGEVVRSRFAPARVVLPNTHHPGHGMDSSGAVWLTDRALRVQVGAFRWAAPLREVRGARDAAGMVEVLAGPTDEPLHLLLPNPAHFVDVLEKERSKESR